jgi:hypothetical protein
MRGDAVTLGDLVGKITCSRLRAADAIAAAGYSS